MGAKTLKRMAWGVALAALAAFAAPASAQTVTLKLGEIYAASHSNTMAANRLAELVSQKTNGALKIDVFADSKLGNERELAESAVAGTVDIAPSGMSGIGRFIQPLQALELPYIYKDLAHMGRVAEAISPDIDRIFKENGLRNIGFFFLGPRSIAGRRPIRTAEDMKGLRLRVPESPLYVGMARALGAVPTPIPFPEAYTSLQTGVADAAEGEPASLFTTKWFEPAKFISLTEHIWHFRFIVMNGAAFDKLTPAHQQALLEAGKEATKYQMGLMNEVNRDALEKMKAGGASIIDIPDRAPFRKALEPFNRDFVLKLGPAATSLFEKAQRVQ
jgi:tripartite ATP-independent transporter DctP family solute receptor